MLQRKFWEEKSINSWSEYEEAISQNNYREWIYRGHSNIEWKLETSLFRVFEDMQKIIREYKGITRNFSRNEHEKLLLSRFQSHASLYLQILPPKDEDLEWLAIMQHHGTPTRLIDMTFSPYVAAFFALEFGYEESCVFALRHTYYSKIDQAVLGKDYEPKLKKVLVDRRGGKSYIFPYEPRLKTERFVSQQGVFLVPSTNYETFEQIIDQYGYEDDKQKPVKKYIFSSKMHYEGLRKLKLMNITSATLFPGLDGFCRSLKYQILDTVKTLRILT